MKKRVLSLFLAITLCLSLTPTGALAAEGQPPEQMVTATQEAETGAGENAPPAKPEENPTEDAPVNCTPFVRQYDILSNKWGVLLCQKEYQTNDIRQNSKNW